MNNPYIRGGDMLSSPVDLDQAQPVYMADGGFLAPPQQAVVYRPGDKEYLTQRQKEAEAYEAQRQAYNTALERYRAEQFDPYQAQVNAYNAALNQYNAEVYEPYKAAYGEYERAVNTWNEGSREADYAGPAEPTLTPFSMQAPVAPKAFEMAAPTVPFDPEAVAARQAEAARIARQDAAARGTGLAVANDPRQFNVSMFSRPSAISGMSVPGYAIGGLVKPKTFDVTPKAPEVLTSKQMLRKLKNKTQKFAEGGEARPSAADVLAQLKQSVGREPSPTGSRPTMADVNNTLQQAVSAGPPQAQPQPQPQPTPAPRDNPYGVPDVSNVPTTVEAMTKRIGELQKQLEGMPETISRRRLIGGGRSTFPNPERTPLQQELDQLMGTRKLFQENEAKLRAEREGQSTPRARPNFGFQPPPKDVAFTSAIVRWVNPKTGEEFRAPSGGWTPPSSDWKVAEPEVIRQPVTSPGLTVRPDVLPPKAPSAPGVYPPDFMGPLPEGAVRAPRPDAPRGSLPMPAPGTPIAPMPEVPDPFGPPPSTVTPPMPAPTPVSPAPRPTPPVPTPPVTPPVIPAPNVPKPGMPTIPTPAVPTPSLPTFGRTPQFFNPPAAPGAAPGTVPIGQRNPYVIQMGQTALDLLQQSPNLAPKTLGGQQNLGFMTDRLGNVIQTPGMPPPVRTFADGGIASRTAALNAYNLSDEEGEPILTDPVGTASQMLRELNPQTETEYRATPEKVSMKRISKTPMGNASGTAKGMKMELDEISAMKMPKDLKAASGMSRSELEELAREYGLKRAAALDTAKGLMRATFEKPTLEKSSLTKGSLTKRRFEEGGEVKKDDGAEEGSSAPSMSYFGGSRSVPGVPEKENIREETLGMIRRMDDASVMAMANRLSGLPFESPVQARVMLEKMLGPSAVSLGVMGSGKVLPERLTGYSLGARTPLAGGEFRAGVDVPRGVGKPMFNVGYAKEFQKGGPVSKGKKPVREAPPRAPQAAKLDSGYTFGSEDAFEFTPAGTRNRMTRFIKSAAGDASNPAAKSLADPQITRSREEFDRLARASKQPPMPSDVSGMFDAFVGPRGAIFVSPLGGPSTYSHEMTHAADYNMGKLYRQAAAAKEQKSNPAAQQFVDAYEKLVGKGPAQENRAEGARRLAPEWFDRLERQQAYRNYPPELAAFAMENAIGGDRGQLTPQTAPLHVDPTLATEFTLLTDLAQKYVDSRANPVRRAEGSPEEGETADDPFRSGKPLRSRTRKPATQEENEALSRAVLQGMANMPYNIAGIPGDLANLLAAPTGKQPFYGSESAKALATQFGIRPAPPTDPTAAALYGAADIGSALVNPAAPVRAAARGAERAGAALSSAAKDFQEYNRMLDVPGASYAVRPEGSQLVIRRDNNPDWVGQLLDDGLRDARYVTPIGAAPERVALMENFWNNKAANYFAKQFGTESDPVYRGIRDQYIKSPRLAKDFPDYVLDQLSVGKTRVDAATGESRFFPKYPAAYDAMRAKYDELTQIRGAVPARDPSQVMDPNYTYSPSRQGTELLDELKNREIDRMIEQGTPVSQAEPSLEFLTRSVKAPDTILGPYNAKSILKDYEKATGTRLGDPNFQGVPEPEALPQNLRTAFDKGEIMYGTSGPNAPLSQLFNTNSINEYLNTLSDRELKNIRFEDAVKGGAKVSAKRQARETLAADIRAGKRVPDKVFSEGVSAPLLQIDEGPLAGFAWKRIEKAEATVPEGAYLGHSVGGYAEGGAYGPGKHRDFNEGRSQVYTLRDNRNRPVTTVEVSMRDMGPIVTQIKGNGRATGNTAPVKYDQAVMQFLQNYLKPARISESDDYLTPILQSYKEALRSTSTQP